MYLVEEPNSCVYALGFLVLLGDLSSRKRTIEMIFFLPYNDCLAPHQQWSGRILKTIRNVYSRRLTSLHHLYSLTLIPPGYNLYKLGLLILRAWSTMKEGKQAVKQRKLVGLSFLPRSPCGNWKDLVIWTRSLQEPIFLPQVLTLSFKFHCTEYYWWWVGQLNCISILWIALQRLI